MLRLQVAARKKSGDGTVMNDDERRKLVSTEQSLGMNTKGKLEEEGTVLANLAQFSRPEPKEIEGDFSDAESFFNLPAASNDGEEDESA